MTILMTSIDNHAVEPKHWLPVGRLTEPFRAAELPKAGTEKIKAAFFGKDDAGKALEALSMTTLGLKELRALASAVRLKAPKKRKDIQVRGRVAFVWWNATRGAYRRSTNAKANAFVSDSDRLAGALALLDSEAIRSGKWVDGETPTVTFPSRWVKSKADGGFAIPKDRYLGGQAVGPALAGVHAATVGNFAPEPDTVNAARGAVERAIVQFIKRNPKARVTVMVVYTYPDKTSRLPTGFRYYATDAAGKLSRQFTFTAVGPRDFLFKDNDFSKE
jgi:hypothetical protein